MCLHKHTHIYILSLSLSVSLSFSLPHPPSLSLTHTLTHAHTRTYTHTHTHTHTHTYTPCHMLRQPQRKSLVYCKDVYNTCTLFDCGQVWVHDRQHHPAHHGYAAPATNQRTNQQVSPSGQLRADGSHSHCFHPC